ncbi:MULTISPECIES: alpha/beta hydrolase [unclassified Herbaspirillum]|uniref:alpha/beta hydrolase n=1 Tax=unclassified Herbaspirillum TaxID=2624150 RepID=UPI000E2E7832|nr:MULTISPECIES: alpha/beta hydrolase [unclassified Herbaspirillum]RFB68676.1 alpha/beta hydrolase [Herbaspirillum sp. 3R-3a1]TFI05581.1 alpha/beta hydrolase [Herbaspirillum sp. 3R11]TFI13509.1 alpha/beta hydrolase [Herbaspirillum sp. 3R-11]TFI22124.1 alpha/beta hydrolase [Herbaspirillum sp. 3C11]
MRDKLFPGLSDQSAEALLALGPVWRNDINRHRQAVVDIYTPLLNAVDKDGIIVTRDIAYGEHVRQKLDVYLPGGVSTQRRPVVMFVHGGAFLRGNMNANEQIYGNVLYYFARQGMVGINVEYRLAPEAPYPAGSDDVAAAVAWARAHAHEYGGDPEQIILIGHSAGGAHAASYIADPRVRPATGHGVAKLVLISARLRADVHADNPNAGGVRAYWGEDMDRYEQVSPVTYAASIDVPLMIAIAEHENPYLDVYAAELFWRVGQARGRAPRFVQVRHHNHTSIVAHMDTDDDVLGRQILDFIEAA